MPGGSLRVRLDNMIEYPVIEAAEMRKRLINSSCKIYDFGLARCEELKSRLSNTSCRQSAVGTLLFTAPEVLKNELSKEMKPSNSKEGSIERVDHNASRNF
mmetsp:Transcript_10395/g.14355  ORF Transcript_10395/g.14355 Transcript_10395/m.14355 type:complete len:101 (-) Transcript_10395:477-779(-)